MKRLILLLLLLVSNVSLSQQKLELCDDDTLAIFTYTTNSGVSGTYFWSIDGGSPVIDGPSYQVVWGLYGEGSHILTVGFVDDIGCEADPVSLNIEVEICVTTSMWAPNCFTPDGDENNNVWLPKGSNYSEPYVFIVNRWGNVVFESYNLNMGWDGSYDGRMCQDGVYIYVLRWKDTEGKLNQIHGHITLLR